MNRCTLKQSLQNKTLFLNPNDSKQHTPFRAYQNWASSMLCPIVQIPVPFYVVPEQSSALKVEVKILIVYNYYSECAPSQLNSLLHIFKLFNLRLRLIGVNKSLVLSARCLSFAFISFIQFPDE
jgi:hypothetical protein